MSNGRIVVLLAACLLPAALLPAQGDPALHHRTDQALEAPQPMEATGHTNLPPPAAGSYALIGFGAGEGSAVELYFDSGVVNGYVLVRGSGDRSMPMTFDFAKTHADGHAITWSTRQVHGEWWSFAGRVERGLDEVTSQEPGFYLLAGTLTHHTPSGDESRTMSLKREPEDG